MMMMMMMMVDSLVGGQRYITNHVKLLLPPSDSEATYGVHTLKWFVKRWDGMLPWHHGTMIRVESNLIKSSIRLKPYILYADDSRIAAENFFTLQLKLYPQLPRPHSLYPCSVSTVTKYSVHCVRNIESSVSMIRSVLSMYSVPSIQ